MWHLTNKPFEAETLDDWARLSIDISKVAILAIPVILLGSAPPISKVFDALFLGYGAYMGLSVARLFRQRWHIMTSDWTFGLAVFAAVMTLWAYFAHRVGKAVMEDKQKNIKKSS